MKTEIVNLRLFIRTVRVVLIIYIITGSFRPLLCAQDGSAEQTVVPKSDIADPQVFRKRDTTAFEFFELHTLPAPKNSKGVLVLFYSPEQPKIPLTQPDWKDFAAKESLALASVGFRMKPGERDRNAIGAEFAALIDEAVEKQFGKDLKKIGYAQSGSVEWFLRALQARPASWSFWGCKGGSNYPLAPRDNSTKGFPPGLVMAWNEDGYAPARRYYRDLRWINTNEQRVTLVKSDLKTIDQGFLDRFFRQYVSAIYAGKVQGKGLWRYNYSHEERPKEGQSPSVDFSWLPNEELAGSWRLLNLAPPAAHTAKIEKISFGTPAGEQDFFVRFPGELATDPSVLPRDVIVWLTREKDDEAMQKKLLGQGDPVIHYAELNNIPIIAWNANSLWPADHLQNAKSTDQALVAASDQKFIKVGDAMIGTLKEYCRQQGWPVRNWLLSADTVAGRYGLMMAQAYPFLAVHLHSASGYERVAESPSAPWLVTSGWLESGRDEASEFYRKAEKERWPVVFKQYPGVGHRSSWDQRTLVEKFFEHVLWLRDGGGESLTWLKRWDKPVLPEKYRLALESEAEPVSDKKEKSAAAELPADFLRADYAPDGPRPSSVVEWFEVQCSRPFLYGNWRRLHLYEPAQLTKQYPRWRVRLPSYSLAEAWNLSAHPAPDLSVEEMALEKSYLERRKAYDEKADKPKAE